MNSVPEVDEYEMVFSGPHFFVSNPYYKTPRINYKNSADYDAVDLELVSEKFIPRSLYKAKKGTINPDELEMFKSLYGTVIPG